MPRDPRLYMTFPNDFHRHPKLRKLPPEVRWTFVEMNGEARIADNDGIFTHEDAEFEWSLEHLALLVSSHPTRPLVVKTDTHYVIRDYAEHQQTKAEREALSAKRSAAGRKGGKAKPSAKQVLSNGEQTEAESESESESESEDFYSPSKSQSRSNRARVSTDAIEVPEMTRRLAAQKGIKSLRVIVDAIHRHTSATVDANQAFQVAVWLLDKAPKWPDSPQRYVTGSIAKSPAEVEQHIFEAVA